MLGVTREEDAEVNVTALEEHVDVFGESTFHDQFKAWMFGLDLLQDGRENEVTERFQDPHTYAADNLCAFCEKIFSELIRLADQGADPRQEQFAKGSQCDAAACPVKEPLAEHCFKIFDLTA